MHLVEDQANDSKKLTNVDDSKNEKKNHYSKKVKIVDDSKILSKNLESKKVKTNQVLIVLTKLYRLVRT